MNIELKRIYDLLYARYGDLNWWPASSHYEVMVGAILTQNTAWSNVEKAIANFEDKLSPEYVEGLSLEKLSETIRPAGFFNQKSVYLKTLTEWYKGYNYSVEAVKSSKLDKLRKELLSLKGIGPETADSILLYAFEFPTFVVDAYTKRLLSRIPIDLPLEYDAIKSFFESNLPKDVKLYNNFHALIVINAKEYCKSKPRCDGCPLDKTL